MELSTFVLPAHHRKKSLVSKNPSTLSELFILDSHYIKK